MRAATRRIALVAVSASIALVASGCAAVIAMPEPTAVRTAAPPAQLTGTVTVFAAASLSESFADIATAFEAAHPGVTVALNLGGSSSLAQQIVQGAPADVFASASPETMAAVSDGGLVAEPAVFATNTLEIATPTGNPGGVTGLADFARPELAIALCAAEVPCGAASVTVLDAAGVTAAVDTYEQDVRAVLTKIELGEIDAGLVYRTDVLAAADSVEGIEFAGAAGAVSRYPIAAVSASTNADAAAAFVTFVLSGVGRGILAGAGFGPA